MKIFKSKKTLIVIGACACVAFALSFAVTVKPSAPDYGYLLEDENGLYTFSSYNQIDRTVKQIIEGKDNCPCYVRGDGPAMTLVGESEQEFAATGDLADSTGDPAGGGKTPGDHSETYKQVEGVDEADIVKTDGRYIYHVSGQENQVIITKVDGDKTKRTSAVREEGDSMIRDIYVNGDKLIVISNTMERTPTTLKSGDKVNAASLSVYDISDRAKPKRTDRYTQTGAVLSSRMTGGRIILITNENYYTYAKGNCVPSISFDGSDPEFLHFEDIRCVPSPATASYTTVGLIDIARGKLSQKTTKTGAILGSSDNIYCNTSELYIAASLLEMPGRRLFSFNDSSDVDLYATENTQIVRVSFEDGKVDYKAVGTVDGRVNNQFSMDSYKGNFRIATTSWRDGTDVNNLFVLDRDLKEVGSLRNFARDEHIEAVRYIGERAYVITYEQTDPLFIVDLKKPDNPTIKGHVKITGFSTLLVPVDKNHLLGFGYSTESMETGEATNGLKLALFDVSDPADPKVADSKEYPGLSSPIQYDHRALLVGPEGQYYAIPYDSYATPWLNDVAPIEMMGATETESDKSDESGGNGNESGGNGNNEAEALIDGNGDKSGGNDSEAKSNGNNEAESNGNNEAEALIDGNGAEAVIDNDGEAEAGIDNDGEAEASGNGNNEAEALIDGNGDKSGGNGILAFDARGSKIKEIRNMTSGIAINRCIYIGDRIYGIAEDDSIKVFKLD